MVLSQSFPRIRSREINHYPHHIGDFNGATRHLTVVERAFYRELIELYYQTEKPLPADDLDGIARRCLAQSDDEKAIIKALLREFFKLDGDVYRHTRCDAELHIYKDKIEKAQRAGKVSALTRAKQSLNNRSTPVQRTFNQPRTKNQEPTLETLSGKPDDAKQILQFLNSKTGRNYQPVKANLEMIAARLKDGATPDELRMVVAKKCREWAGDEKMNQYLRPATLFNRTKYAQYQGELINIGGQDAMS